MGGRIRGLGNVGNVLGNSSQSERGFNLGTDCGHAHLDEHWCHSSITIPSPVICTWGTVEDVASLTSGGCLRPQSSLHVNTCCFPWVGRGLQLQQGPLPPSVQLLERGFHPLREEKALNSVTSLGL